MKSSYPALGDKTFERYQPGIQTPGAMTINGTINKTLILLALVIIPAVWVWDMFYESGIESIGLWMYEGFSGIEFLRLLSKLRQ